MRDMEKIRERRYWKNQYEYTKELYEDAKVKAEAEPNNPWYQTRLKNLQDAYLEANDKYYSLLEE